MKIQNLLLLALICLFANCKDECKKINCLNGGTCFEGACNCTEQWFGDRCEKQATPKNITVSQIEVLKFPAKNAGGGEWDSDSRPDLFVVVRDKDKVPIFGNVATRLTDATVGGVMTAPNFKFEKIFDAYTFQIWEYDEPPFPDTLMATSEAVVLYSTTNNFPEKVDIGCAACPLHLRMKLKYNYQ